MMEYIEVKGKCYEVLEKGDLYGNISHVRYSTGKISPVVSTAYDLDDEFYFIVKRSGGEKDFYWEKDFEEFPFTPLKLIGPDLTDLEVAEPDFISARVVGVREYDDDYSIVELKVPSYVAGYWFIRKELEFSEEGDLE